MKKQVKVARRAYQHRYYLENREAKLARNKIDWLRYARQARLDALDHYGGRLCVCCGETNPLFLTLDHKNNDGGEWRKQMAKADGQNQQGKRYLQGTNFYIWLRKNNYPELGLQVACYNCNLGRARNRGVCPHKVTML